MHRSAMLHLSTHHALAFHQDAVLHGLVLMFDRHPGLGIGGCAKGMLEDLLRQPLREGVRDEARRVVGE
jgi:hypothetical protein